MDYTTLGRTELKVSVAGLGCGGFSRLGLNTGGTEASAIAIIHAALDHGVNLLDTAAPYDTEGVVGKRAPRQRYLVAVCGERLPFEKEADARLEWTRDVRRAEFFIAPTHMNCDRALDGNVVANIERLGVVIGVVKDRRALLRSVAGLN